MQLSKFIKPRYKKSRLVIGLWFAVSSILFRVGYSWNWWRRFLLRLFSAKIGKGVIIRPSVKIHFPWNLEIGDYSWVGEEAMLYSIDKIKIGKNCVVSQRAFLSTATHNYKKESFDIITKPIIIEDGCWIGAMSFLHPGIHIRKNCVIGAMSNVTKNMPPNSICFGNPCKFRKSLSGR